MPRIKRCPQDGLLPSGRFPLHLRALPGGHQGCEAPPAEGGLLSLVPVGKCVAAGHDDTGNMLEVQLLGRLPAGEPPEGAGDLPFRARRA